MLDSLITSKTRLKLILKFFSNVHNISYLRSLATEFNENTNAVRIELNRLTQAGLLTQEPQGNTVIYRANSNYPFYKELHHIVLKYLQVNDILEKVISKLGDLELAYIKGDYANGRFSNVVELVIVSKWIDSDYLEILRMKAQEKINKKIELFLYTPFDFKLSNEFQFASTSLILYASANSGFSTMNSVFEFNDGLN